MYSSSWRLRDPAIPWICAVIYGFLPRGDYDNDVEMMKPGQDGPAATAAAEQREKEDCYWAWVCPCALVGVLLLAGVGEVGDLRPGLVGGI